MDELIMQSKKTFNEFKEWYCFKYKDFDKENIYYLSKYAEYCDFYLEKGKK